MANTGAKYPTAASTADVDPWLDNAWGAATAICADNGAAASVVHVSYDTGDQTGVLYGYTFDMSAIPTGSTIDGVICAVNVWCATANAGSMDLMRLTNTALTMVGNNQCATAVVIGSSTATVITKGSSTDVWGNSLTAAWVKHANFGVGIGVLANVDNVDVFVDYVNLTVYYTAGAGWANIAKVNGVAASAINKIYTAGTSTITKIYGKAV